ncbi:hypothetical protein IWQ57_000684 [Coemansia nantahalensis]|uniref:Uncharacterized protein n=1 Tax=Coemansia nantahalensis TaxID=2789366 RepID=A0ACC1K7T1_9FUNG|nr:hypothetical protein IWQ57_000684 [Coemansia nantahalensis]
MATAAPALHIGVVLDIVCPWCYVGKRRIEKAIELARQKRRDLEVSVEYMPYQLVPDLGHGLDKREYYRNRFGDRAAVLQERVAAAGAEDGISFSFGGKISNTLDAHRLIDYARLQGGSAAESTAVESLMRRYFELEQDIGEADTLLAAAEDAHLDRKLTAAYLQSDDGVDAVRTKIAAAAKLGISGVPFYIINDRYGVSGAETPEALVDAFEKALQTV